MEKILNPYDKEYMKMAMLKHEETFREQVYELHRLYQIQKQLMKNITKSKQREELGRWNFMTATNSNPINGHQNNQKRHRQYLDLESPAEEYVARTEGIGMREIEDESDLELTLGPTSQCRRRKTLETSLPADSAASFSSSSSGSSHIKRTNSRNHQRRYTEIGELTGKKWGLDMPSSNPVFLAGRKNSSDIEEQLRQDRHNNPPWLFQALSLNTT